jgi:predicted DNA-binding protein
MSRPTSIRLDDALSEELELVALIEGRSVADELREAVAMLITKKRGDEAFARSAEQFAQRVQEFALR